MSKQWVVSQRSPCVLVLKDLIGSLDGLNGLLTDRYVHFILLVTPGMITLIEIRQTGGVRQSVQEDPSKSRSVDQGKS
ncbi:hypothetical protein RRG08_041192 [Elysia crispata]|uniref:Uncharacterized protein n=1 Tax=Elysia crispata TaxID=231223 RepID=A0AAE1CPC8_9GAST|nr:hypothetical protein RRG08_041192 [Elysia crispata]